MVAGVLRGTTTTSSPASATTGSANTKSDSESPESSSSENLAECFPLTLPNSFKSSSATTPLSGLGNVNNGDSSPFIPTAHAFDVSNPEPLNCSIVICTYLSDWPPLRMTVPSSSSMATCRYLVSIIGPVEYHVSVSGS